MAEVAGETDKTFSNWPIKHNDNSSRGAGYGNNSRRASALPPTHKFSPNRTRAIPVSRRSAHPISLLTKLFYRYLSCSKTSSITTRTYKDLLSGQFCTLSTVLASYRQKQW
jgi:hypothetical protein